MLKNLAALGLGNLEHASSIRRLNELLKNDYLGIIVTMIHKFRDMPADLNLRKNIYVLIDEAHCNFREQLMGLSAKSLGRWATATFVAKDDVVLAKLTQISGSLFFLATKSQEQITEDYSLLSREVSALIKEPRELMGNAVESR